MSWLESIVSATQACCTYSHLDTYHITSQLSVTPRGHSIERKGRVWPLLRSALTAQYLECAVQEALSELTVNEIRCFLDMACKGLWRQCLGRVPRMLLGMGVTHSDDWSGFCHLCPAWKEHECGWGTAALQPGGCKREDKCWNTEDSVVEGLMEGWRNLGTFLKL